MITFPSPLLLCQRMHKGPLQPSTPTTSYTVINMLVNTHTQWCWTPPLPVRHISFKAALDFPVITQLFISVCIKQSQLSPSTYLRCYILLQFVIINYTVYLRQNPLWYFRHSYFTWRSRSLNKLIKQNRDRSEMWISCMSADYSYMKEWDRFYKWKH